MATKAPGKADRKGISVIELTEMFPHEQAAVEWFEAIQWPGGRYCGHCGSVTTKPVPNQKPMPYWCSDCRSYFSVRTGTALQSSRLPLKKWAFATYLYVTNLKGVSSMKLHRDLNVSQKTAWFMLHRLREAWGASGIEQLMAGPVEVDETYVGGKRKNMSKAKRKALSGRGFVGKVAVAGVKDRKSKKVVAKVVTHTDTETLQGFVRSHVEVGAMVYTDEHRAYENMAGFDHETVKHSVGEYVRDQAHTGTFHRLSEKHLQRYVNEFSGRHGVRDRDTADQMQDVVAGLTGKRLMYRDLVS